MATNPAQTYKPNTSLGMVPGMGQPVPGNPGVTAVGGMDAFTSSPATYSPGTGNFGDGSLKSVGTGMPDPRRSGVPTAPAISGASMLGGGYQATGTTSTPAASPGAAPGTFSATQNLINTQIDPTPSSRLATARGEADTARTAYANAATPTLGTVGTRDTSETQRLLGRAETFADALGGGGPGGGPAPSYGGPSGFGYSGDTQSVRKMTLDQLQKVLNTTPDRATLSANAFQRLLSESAPQFAEETRLTNARNAAMGRRGSGMATTDLGTVQQRREEALMRERGRLADEAAGLSLSDVMNQLNAARGVGDSFAGQDTAAGSLNLGAANSAFGNRLASWEANQRARQQAFDNFRTLGSDQYGIASDLYGDSVSERDKRYGADKDAFGFNRSRVGDLYDIESQITGSERADRNETRGERDYQYGLSRDAQGDQIAQWLAQEQAYGNDWNRGRDMFGVGMGTDPYGAYGDAAGAAGQNAANASGAGMDLLTAWAQNRARRQTPTQPNGAPLGPPPQITIPDFNL